MTAHVETLRGMLDDAKYAVPGYGGTYAGYVARERVAALEEAIRTAEAVEIITAAINRAEPGKWYTLSSRVRIVDDKLVVEAAQLEAQGTAP